MTAPINTDLNLEAIGTFLCLIPIFIKAWRYSAQDARKTSR